MQKKRKRETNIIEFNHVLEQITFEPMSQIDYPNQSFNEFINIYNNKFELAFPLTQTKPNNKHVKREPWVIANGS